jgi:hypothetical protein
MSPRTKRFLTYILLFIIAGMITLGAIWWFTRSSTNPDGSPNDGGGLQLFPFGNPTDPGNTNPSRPGFNPNQPQTGINFNRRLPRLRMISGEPVSGFFATETLATSTLVTGTTTEEYFENAVVYTQRVTGHIYQAKESTEQQQRLSNTTIPKVYEALYASSTSVLYRYLADDMETIRTFIGELKNGTSTLTGTFLANDLDEVVISPSGTEIVYGIENGDKYFLNLSKTDGSNPISVFSSYAKQWNVQWPKTDSLYLTPKSDSRYSGSLYKIDPATKQFDKLVSDVLGLSTLVNKDGTKAVLSYYDKAAGVGTAIFDTATREYLYPQFRTLAEKCVWSNADASILYCAVPIERIFEAMPEGWYMRKVVTTDTIFRVDTKTMEAIEVMTEADTEGNLLDMYNLALSDDEKYIYFMNKRDLTLWSYELSVPAAEQGPAAGPTM